MNSVRLSVEVYVVGNFVLRSYHLEPGAAFPLHLALGQMVRTLNRKILFSTLDRVDDTIEHVKYSLTAILQ